MSRDPILGMFASRKRIDLALWELKKERTYKQTKQLLREDKLYGLRDLVCGLVTTRKWNETLNLPVLPRSKNWIQELGWMTHAFIAHADSINDFIELRSEFFRHYMLGEYSRADETLKKVRDKFGNSFWLAEHQFMLYQAREEFEENKAHLASIQADVLDPLIGYLMTMVSKRLEPQMTHDAYAKSTNDTLTKLRKSGHVWLAHLVEFHVSPWTTEWTTKTNEILHRCCARPLVDRYSYTLKVLSYINQYSHQEADERQLVAIFDDLNAAIKDPSLTRLGSLFLNRNICVALSEKSQSYYSALDKFYCGNFPAAASSAEDLLKEDPSVFEYYWLLARSNVCCQTPRVSSLGEKCTAQRILKSLQEIAANRLDINVFLVELLFTALKLGDAPLGIKVWQFAEEEGSGSVNSSAIHYAAISNPIQSTKDFSHFHLGYRNGCLRGIEASCTSHPSLSYYFFKDGLSPTTISLPNTIAKEFRIFASATVANRNGNYQEVLNLLHELDVDASQSSRIKTFLAGDRARLEFTAQLALCKPQDAALSAIGSYIDNPNTLRHVHFEEVIEGVKNGRWSNIRSTPYFPVLVFLNNGDEQDIYEAVDDFLTASEYGGPLDLLNEIDKLPIAVSRVLLRNVLVPTVLMRGALWAKTPDAQRNIRTQILKHLFAISVHDQALVVDELADVERARLLEEAYRNVEGPKFSFDFADLNRYLAAVLAGVFERYTSYKAYEDKGGQLAVEEDLLEMAKKGGTIKQIPEKKTETSEVLLSNMRFAVVGEYIWNSLKGLSGTLGTRIRHGSLENQLKRIFGAKNLLATKDLDGEYQCDKVVLNVIDTCSLEEREKISTAYVSFTRDINHIYDSLMSKLRVRVPAPVAFVMAEGGSTNEYSSDDGIIDFSTLFSDENLSQLKPLNIRSILGLIAEIHRIFVASVEREFSGVRHYIASVVANEINAAIKKLDDIVAKTLGDGWQRAQLRGDILAAKDGFANDLKIIQTWFSIAVGIDSGIGSIKKLFAMAGHVVDFASNGKLGRLSEGVVSDERVAPEAGVMLYEVLSILLRNVVQHSGVKVGQRVTYSYEVKDSGGRVMTVTNLMHDPAQTASAVKNANMRLNGPRDPRVLDRSPGGTGLRRVQALLQQVSTQSVVVIPSQGDSDCTFRVRIEY